MGELGSENCFSNRIGFGCKYTRKNADVKTQERKNAIEFRSIDALTVVWDVAGGAGGGGGGGSDGLFLIMECEFVSETNGRAKNRSRSCMYALIKISNFSSMSATCKFIKHISLTLMREESGQKLWYIRNVRLWPHEMLSWFSMHKHLLPLILACPVFDPICLSKWIWKYQPQC